MTNNPKWHESERSIPCRGVLKHGNTPGDPWSAPRCGAKTRAGTPCRGPAVRGRRRCRMHGGTNPGPPKGSQNALKHGRRSAAAVAARKAQTAKTRQITADLAGWELAMRAIDGEELTAEEIAEAWKFIDRAKGKP